MAHPESRTIEHMAVILARGQSSRLGSPKGMAKVPGSHQTLLSAVDELYQKRGWPRIVVTLPELLPSYQGLLDHDPTRQWVTFGPGGDTARTLRVAWEHMQKKSGFGDWMWAHPVDVPLVQTKTLDKIQSTLDPGGQQVYRPVHQGQPGHPVVLSHHFLDSVFSGFAKAQCAFHSAPCSIHLIIKAFSLDERARFDSGGGI